jgi:uncharacterized protein (DUF1697 family)
MRHLALLRGVNVGGARMIAMRELEEIFASAGGGAVTTYIESGNIIFNSDFPAEVCARAELSIESRFGFRPPVILRSADAWRAMVEANPFVAAYVDPHVLHVACLAAAPVQPGSGSLEPHAFLPDAFVVAGPDIYLHLPNGVAKSGLNNARLDRAFRTVSTMRNWRTAVALLERLDSRGLAGP